MKTVVKFRKFQIGKIFNTDTKRIFSNSFHGYVYIYFWDIHSLKNNSAVRKSWFFCFFLNWRAYFQNMDPDPENLDPEKDGINVRLCLTLESYVL